MIFKLNFITKFKRKRFYQKLITKNDLCFDIGANIGTKSKLFLNVGAKVIAFEPQSSCFDELKKIKNKYSNFDFYPFAVGAQNEEKELHLSNHSEVATLSDKFIKSYSSNDVYWNKIEIVSVKSLDFLITQYGLPKFCKIDVEGYEFEILSNLNYKIPIIEFEFTGKFIAETLKIIDLLGNNYVYNFILNEHLKFKLNNCILKDEMKDIIESFSNSKVHGNLFCKIKTND